MNRYKSKNRSIISVVILLSFIVLYGCASERYMLDDPVNDPIMFADDQQDSDLVKVEEGGGGSAGGGCPT